MTINDHKGNIRIYKTLNTKVHINRYTPASAGKLTAAVPSVSLFTFDCRIKLTEKAQL